MKIAYVGNFQPEFSTENDVRKAFEHLGHRVICIQENQIILPLLEEYALSSGLVLITSTWDHAIPLAEWIGIMKKCADRGIPTATLHLDVFWSTPRKGRLWWLNPMFHTAHIFTADGDHQEKWKAFGKNHTWLPPAVRHDATHFGKFREEYACDVAFVGSNGINYHEDVWRYRTDLLNELWIMCKRNGWKFKNPGGDMPKIERNEDLNDFYASAKIIVGDSLCIKKEESNYWSDRVPETTGRGGHLVMPQIQALSDLYDHNLPMYEWGDWKHLEKIISVLLENEHDPTIKEQRNLCQKITAEQHTYVNRVQAILQTVGLA